MIERFLPMLTERLFLPIRDTSVGGKLLLVVLLPLGMTLIATQALIIHSLTRLESNISTARLHEEAKVISLQFAQFEKDLKADAERLANDPTLLDAIQSGDRSDLQTIFLRFSAHSSDFDYLEVMDNDGRILYAKDSFGPEGISLKVDGADTIGLSEIQAIQLAPMPQGWLFKIVQPLEIQKAGSVGTLSVGRLLTSSTLSELNFERSNPRLALINTQGKLSNITETEAQHNSDETFAIDRDLWGQAANGQVAFGRTHLQGEIQQVAYVPLEVGEQAAVFCVILSTAAATGLRNQMIFTSLIGASLLAVLATVAALKFGNHFIIRPITALIAAAKQIRPGQSEMLVPNPTDRDEIGRLSDVLTDIAAELRRTSTRENAILQSALDCIVNIDHHGSIVEFNRAAEKTFGYSRTQALGRSMSELVDPSSWEGQLHKNMTHYFSAGRGTMIGRRFEVIAKHANGVTFPAELAITITRVDGLPLFTAFVRDISARKQAEEQIRASLKEKEALLQEIHHRVKNNLQVISSLLNLECRHVTDPQVIDTLQDSKNRVRSMALIHEKLYQSENLAHIDFTEYIRDLARYLHKSYSANTRDVSLNVHSDEVFLAVETATPCGLILNELVSNALKHAFPHNGSRPPNSDTSPGGDTQLPSTGRHDGRAGEIRVELIKEDAHLLTLMVGDNGIGFPEDLDFHNSASMGLRLVNTLVRQLNGTIELDRSRGTQFKISFTAPDPGS